VTVLRPELLLDASGVRRGCAVELAGGAIRAVGPSETVELAGIALAPGFVNAHSHAFQRALRGRVERRETQADDFWSWRQQMYAAAARLDPETIHEDARSCYRQLRRAGYTSVGEFHYVHHRPDGTSYDDANALAQAVCEAAEAEGLRICLLLTAYERAAVPAQRRFCDPDVETYLARAEALRAWAADRPLVTVGVAPHSVRAVSREWLVQIGRYARVTGLPLHVHAGEQQQEVAECQAEHGLRPIELLAATEVLGERTTVVHATHADARERDLLAASGTTVCLCPTTEGNLGDGWPPTEQLVAAGVALAIGSDSNVRLDPLEELREVETCARRVAQRRNVLAQATLLAAAWDGGAHALGLPRPRLEAGAPADLIAIDLAHHALHGVADEDLAAALIFAGDASAVVRTWVGGA
jgi:formimidoylglutamate deiminase